MSDIPSCVSPSLMVMNARLKTFVLLLCAIGMTAGCIPYPLLPSGNIYPIEDDIEDLVDKAAAKSEVIEKLGKPLKYRKTSMSYKACGTTVGIGYIICLPYACDGGAFVGSECFELVLEFDDKNHLLSYQEIPWQEGFNSTKEDMNLLMLADQGDDIARHLWEQSSTYVYSEKYENELIKRIDNSNNTSLPAWKLYLMRGRRPEDIKFLCKAADGGIKKAQVRLGWAFRIGDGVVRDIEKSYMWYKLASSKNYNENEYFDKAIQKQASVDLTYLKKSMTLEEIRQAEQLFSKWMPGQCERELVEPDHSTELK
jgi:hypothetical protein